MFLLKEYFLVGGGEGKLVTVETGDFGTAGATEPDSLVQMVWLGEGYQLH